MMNEVFPLFSLDNVREFPVEVFAIIRDEYRGMC